MSLTRARALSLIGAAALVPACSHARDPRAVAVGSKNFTEELVLGELYAQLLEKHGFAVERTLNLGGTDIAMEALQRGEIDLYPEYTGTALLTVLKRTPSGNGAQIYREVARAYEQQYGLTWLRPAPMNDTQALATTRAIAARYHLRTLSELAVAAPQLRLGAVPEFLKRPDGLPGLQRAYGGFHFKSVNELDIGLKYTALLQNDVDVVVAFGTDGAIGEHDLLLFTDDRHFWPEYNVAPVVRDATLRAHPQIRTILDGLAPLLTDGAMRALNQQVDGEEKADAGAAAHGFLAAHGLV
jgi:osmoprotectant transport system substrate-binding protein